MGHNQDSPNPPSFPRRRWSAYRPWSASTSDCCRPLRRHNILKGYLNDLDRKGIDIIQSTRADVYDFVHDVFFGENPFTNKPYSKNTINQTIFSLGRAYESLYLQGYRLHDSLLVPQDGAQIITDNQKSKRVTNIGLMKKVFLARKDDIDRYAAPSYLKWYSSGDVNES